MVTKRASKRRRMKQNEPKEEKEKEPPPPPPQGVDENSEKSMEKSAKKAKIEESPVVVFAHGAGAPSSSEWMIRWKGMLAKALNAIEVVTFDYPCEYMLLLMDSHYYSKGMNGAVRDETLLQLTVPVMFVQGSKDGLCPLEQLEAVRKKMNSVTALHVIEGGDHSFKIAKKHLQSTGSNQEAAEDQALQAITSFVSSYVKER